MFRDPDAEYTRGPGQLRRAYDRTCYDLAYARKHNLRHEKERLMALRDALEQTMAGRVN